MATSYDTRNNDLFPLIVSIVKGLRLRLYAEALGVGTYPFVLAQLDSIRCSHLKGLRHVVMEDASIVIARLFQLCVSHLQNDFVSELVITDFDNEDDREIIEDSVLDFLSDYRRSEEGSLVVRSIAESYVLRRCLEGYYFTLLPTAGNVRLFSVDDYKVAEVRENEAHQLMMSSIVIGSRA